MFRAWDESSVAMNTIPVILSSGYTTAGMCILKLTATLTWTCKFFPSHQVKMLTNVRLNSLITFHCDCRTVIVVAKVQTAAALSKIMPLVKLS